MKSKPLKKEFSRRKKLVIAALLGGGREPPRGEIFAIFCCTCHSARLHHHLASRLLAFNQQITHRLGGAVVPRRQSIGSAEVLLEGLEIITGSAPRDSFTVMNITKRLNYLDV